MTNEEHLFRFGGIQRLYGQKAFEKLRTAHVLIVGLGGVGSWVVESLARTAVGSLTLVDFDDICVSNTNRQIQALTSNVGKLKSEALKDRVLEINPQASVKIIDRPYGPDSEAEIFSESYDVVVDALDHGLTKFHLTNSCKNRGLSLVVVGSAGGRQDPTQIRACDLSQSIHDPMLAILRKDLRQKAGFPRKGLMGVDCVYSLEWALYPTTAGEVCIEKPEDFKRPLDCATGLGTATHVTGSFGFMAAHLAIKRIIDSQSGAD